MAHYKRNTVVAVSLAMLLAAILGTGVAYLSTNITTTSNSSTAITSSSITSTLSTASVSSTTTSSTISEIVSSSTFYTRNVTLYMRIQIIYSGNWNGSYTGSAINGPGSATQLIAGRGSKNFSTSQSEPFSNGARICVQAEKLDNETTTMLQIIYQSNDTNGLRGSYQVNTTQPFRVIGVCQSTTIP